MAECTSTVRQNWGHETANYWEYQFVVTAHPQVLQWPLVTDAWKCLLIQFTFYVFIVHTGPFIMRKRTPFDLRWFMVPYNVFLVVTNFYLFCEFVRIRWSGGLEVQRNTVGAPNLSPELYRLAEIIWYFYMTKYLELIDTIIFVLRKKDRQLSFLHIVHHTFVPILVFFLLRSDPVEYTALFPVANSFVHFIMYTYYGISALGDEVTIHLKFKKYVTMIQLIQFIIVLSYYLSRPFYSSTWSPTIVLGNLGLAGFFFVLFCNFYWNEYTKKPEALDQNGIKKVR